MLKQSSAGAGHAFRVWAVRPLFLSLALALPLTLPLGWIWQEYRAVEERLRETAATGAAWAEDRLGGLLGRFESMAARLRPGSTPTENATLTARLLRLEPQLMPASALLVLNLHGRMVAGSHPASSEALTPEASAWLRGVIEGPSARPIFQLFERQPPFGLIDNVAIGRRLDDPQGTAVGVALTSLSSTELRRLIHPNWLSMHGSVRLTDAETGRLIAEFQRESAIRPTGIEATIVASLRFVVEALLGQRPLIAEASIGPGNLRVTVQMDPWEALGSDRAALVRRGAAVTGLALSLILTSLMLLLRERTAALRMAPLRKALKDMPTDIGAEPETAAPEVAHAERDRVLAAIGHDVRTPINSILGIAALLLDGDLEDGQRQWVQRIRASCELLLAMLNGLLEASSAGADGAELNLDEVDVDELVREIGDVLRPQLHDKGLELRIGIEAPVLGYWHIDPTRVRQVLCNLLGNAIKFTDQGSVEVRVSVASTPEGQDRLRVQVSDTGPGIEASERARIFERYGRGQHALAGGREGVGLGLALCRDIAGLMQGAITLESRPGEGSAFTFEFPAERIVAGRRTGGVPFAGRNALVVGLSEGVRRRLASQLEGLGFAVDTAADGYIGLGMAERTAAMRGALDLVVVDGAMTGMAAEAVVIRLRASQYLQSAHIVWVASTQGPTSVAADAVVPHPGDPQDIRTAVFRLLGPTSALQAVERDAPEPAQGRVLVVEDNKINQALLADILRRAGFSVFTANDGEEAVRALGRGGFDLCLMDVQMPGMDGIEATREARAAEGNGRRTPIVALTAHTGGTIRRRCREAGADVVLHKPINIARLPVQLREVIAAARLTDNEDQRENTYGSDGALRSERSPVHAQDPVAANAGQDVQAGDEAVVDPVYLESLILEFGAARAREVLREFLAETEMRLPRLAEIAIAGEWTALARACHDLTGLAGTFGAIGFAESLHRLASTLEPEDAAAALVAVSAEWGRTRPALQRHVNAALGVPGRRGKAA
jgi:signal transduction histidine kinase/CheY-like chemotaxis protein